jgi:STE24 endopeptidase
VPTRLRLPIAVIGALAVAEAAVVLMRPRDRIAPLDVAPRAYFSQGFIEKATGFRTGQLWLYGGQLAVELAVFAWVVRRPPRALAGRRVLGGAAAAAGLSVALTVASLPLGAVSRQRAKDVGLVTQSWGGYAGDVAKSTAIGAGLAAVGGALLVVAMRRPRRGWWAPAAAVVI